MDDENALDGMLLIAKLILKHGNEQGEQSQAAATLTNGISKPMPPKISKPLIYTKLKG